MSDHYERDDFGRDDEATRKPPNTPRHFAGPPPHGETGAPPRGDAGAGEPAPLRETIAVPRDELAARAGWREYDAYDGFSGADAPLIEADHVTVQFGGIMAVCEASLSAEAGRVTGLIGPNGAGKTTLFNVLTGLQKPTSGSVHFGGRDITGHATHERARMGIARTFQRLEAFGSLSVWENVLVAAEIHRQHGMRRRRQHETPAQATERLIRRVGLDAYARRQADTVPTGIARLLELARALALDPRLLLLDEPSSGLSTSETESFGHLLLDLAEEGRAVLIVEHDMELIMTVCDRIHVLNFGEVIASGSPAQIRANEDVQRAYLGQAA
jgi:branched-chain amino acid transport system ATP-binding protein